MQCAYDSASTARNSTGLQRNFPALYCECNRTGLTTISCKTTILAYVPRDSRNRNASKYYKLTTLKAHYIPYLWSLFSVYEVQTCNTSVCSRIIALSITFGRLTVIIIFEDENECRQRQMCARCGFLPCNSDQISEFAYSMPPEYFVTTEFFMLRSYTAVILTTLELFGWTDSVRTKTLVKTAGLQGVDSPTAVEIDRSYHPHAW